MCPRPRARASRRHPAGQARAIAGEEAISMLGVFRNVVAEYGVAGLFKGLIPRMGLNIWQTLFMVTGAQMIKDALN